MQIFASSSNPIWSARALDDARVIKMVTETAQLLSAAARSIFARDMPPDISWRNDPLIFKTVDLYKVPPSGASLWQWAAKEVTHYDWLVCHGKALLEELDFRKLAVGKLVVPRAIINALYSLDARKVLFPEAQPSYFGLNLHFVNRTTNQKHGLDFTHVADVHDAYRQYLTARWALEPNAKWTNTTRPSWS